MRFYIDSHCIAINGAQCVKPALRFGATGGLYDIPTTTNHGDGGNDHGDDHDDGSGHGDDGGERPTECCSDGECRGSQICSDGACGRPSRSSSGSGSADGGCSADSDCRGSQVCSDGVCGRSSSGGAGRGGSCGGGAGRGGGGRGDREEAVAFDGVVVADSESGFKGISLQNATVNVSTVMAMVVMAMAVLIGRCCFWKRYGQKAVGKGQPAKYGAMDIEAVQ